MTHDSDSFVNDCGLSKRQRSERIMASYQVRVQALGDRVVASVKTLRLVADLGLRDAKGLTDYIASHAPCVLIAGVEQGVAAHVVDLLKEAGAVATVEESELREPMLLCPEANQRYRWHWLSGPTPVEAAPSEGAASPDER
jgi:ribosomal protein L7/L12